MTLTDNVISWYLRATDAEVSEGMDWYANAYRLAESLSPNNVPMGAGVISAFSMNTPWKQNVVLATRFFANSGVMDGGTFGHSISKAKRIHCGGDIPTVLNGRKMRAFADNIARYNTSLEVTIDRHAYGVANNSMQSGCKVPAREYDTLAQAFTDAAGLSDILPSQMQAITWIAYRRVKGIK